MASKISNFFEENCRKALNFQGQIQDYADKSSYIENQPMMMNDRSESPLEFKPSMVQERTFMKSSMPLTSTGYSGDRLRTGDSPNRTCLNHFLHHPSVRSINERPISHGRSSFGSTGINFRNPGVRFYESPISSHYY